MLIRASDLADISPLLRCLLLRSHLKHMLRRSVFRLATPRSQPSPSSLFDINLTSVFNTGHLPRNSANEFIKQCLPTLTLLKNDVALTAWRTMNPSELKQTMRANFPNQTEESVDKAVAFVFNSLNIHPQLQIVITGCEQRDELVKLRSKGITTLCQFRMYRSDIQDESNVVRFLDNYVQLIDELFAWLDPEVLAFKKLHSKTLKGSYSQHLCDHMPLLTHHHHYYEKQQTNQKTALLGKERNEKVNELLDKAFSCETKETKSKANVSKDKSAKERKPIQFVVAPPRHGKSLMLAQVVGSAAKHAEGKNFSAVGITFSSASKLELTTDVTTIDDVKHEFWGRVVHAWYYAMCETKDAANVGFEEVTATTFSQFHSKSFFGCMTFEVALALAKSLGLERILIAADEVSKLTDRIQKWGDATEKMAAMSTITEMYNNSWSLLGSGFTHEHFATMETLSNRSTIKTMLEPLRVDTRADFDLMKDFVRAQVGIGKFTPALRSLYEIVKNVPGYMGVWVEMLDTGQTVDSLDDLDLPFIKGVEEKLLTDSSLFSGYWRAMAHGAKASHVGIASGVMGELEKLGVIVILPGRNDEGQLVSHRFLSPAVIAHSTLARAREFNVISDAIKAMTQVVWTKRNKGAALEEIVQASLLLNAMYVNRPLPKDETKMAKVSLEAFIQRLCGQMHIRVTPAKDGVDESKPVKFPTNKSNELHVREVEAFPSVFHKDPTLQDGRLEQNIKVLESPGVVVLKPQFSNNKGCDRIMVCRIGNKKDVALLIFETKYYTANSANAADKDSVKKKAIDTLDPLLQYVQHCIEHSSSIRIRRVCFVYCNTAVRPKTKAPKANADIDGSSAGEVLELKKNPFQVEDTNKFIHTMGNEAELHKITQALAAEGCTTSLHTVWTEEEWLNLLDCLYFVVPDIGDESIDSNAAS